MKNNKKQNELSYYLTVLAKELDKLQANNYPLDQTDLFYKKCIHLEELLKISGPNTKTTKKANNVTTIKENFFEYKNWILSLKYRIELLEKMNSKKLKTKKIELQIPSFLKWEIGPE